MLTLDAHYFKGLPVLLESDTGKKIYGKFMNIADETAQAWLQGVVDLVKILHIDTQGWMCFGILFKNMVYRLQRKCVGRFNYVYSKILSRRCS